VLEYGLPFVFTVLVWWASTGAILYLDGLPRSTFPWTMTAMSIVASLAVWGLWYSSGQTTVAGAYCGFTCAILIWAWQEVAFLLGYVTGPRRGPCPEGASGWRRARYAFEAVSHHEIALVILAVAVVSATWDRPNATGLWTYLVLWTMRQSAKLNVFLGVRNLNADFLPPHLKYLQTYFVRAPMNALLPVSVAAATIVAIPLWQAAFAPGASAFTVASTTLVASLLTLAILEHALLVLPLPAERLWSWGMRSHRASGRAVPGVRAGTPPPTEVPIVAAIAPPPPARH
jgi:putative photosynthetic complex assembly protein 2